MKTNLKYSLDFSVFVFQKKIYIQPFLIRHFQDISPFSLFSSWGSGGPFSGIPFFILSIFLYMRMLHTKVYIYKTFKNGLKNACLHVYSIFGVFLITSIVDLSKNVNWYVCTCLFFFFKFYYEKFQTCTKVESWLLINSHLLITRLMFRFISSILQPISCSAPLHYFKAISLSYRFSMTYSQLIGTFKSCVAFDLS